mgnify:CR=1 FL=1
MNQNPNPTSGALVKFAPNLDSKAKVAEAAQQLTQAVHNGDIDAKEAAVALDAMAKVLKAAIDDIDELVLTELGKYHKGERINVGRIELQPRETATRYDYAGTGDVVYARLLVAKADIDRQLKDREALLKVLKEPTTLVDESTGEVYTVSPPARTSVSTYAILYPKD